MIHYLPYLDPDLLNPDLLDPDLDLDLDLTIKVNP
jgi:hypothetical protein